MEGGPATGTAIYVIVVASFTLSAFLDEEQAYRHVEFG